MRLLVAFFVLFIALEVFAELPDGRLVRALIAHESGGDDEAVGDRGLEEKAYGCLQIRQPAVDDYNRWTDTAFKAEDCLGNRKLSVEICISYIDHYATPKRIGRTPTDEDKARIWNGGPNGWKKASTVEYWRKVKTKLAEERKDSDVGSEDKRE